MIAQPVTIPQAHHVLAHYTKRDHIQVEICKRHKRSVSCTGSQSLCVYHGKTCVPMEPIRYIFTLYRKGGKIIVDTRWNTSL